MPRAAPIQNGFNSGELSFLIDGRVDIAKYTNGCKLLENYYPTIQGPAKRRGGTRFVAEVKDSSKQTWLIRFEFNTQQAYILEFGDLYIRFYTQRSQVTSGGPPYEIASPYASTDLTNSDGTFAINFTESNDIIYLVHPNYQPQKLSRLAPTNWTLTPLSTTNGPFKGVNITATTVIASAITGAITLTASAPIFLAGHVGSIFYMQQPTVTAIKQWEAGKVVAINDIRRSNGVNYKALTAGTTGGNKPIHFEGAVIDGDPGVQWQYQEPGYGYATITGFTSTTIVNAVVINQLPAVGVTTKWAFGAYSTVEGWPTNVTFFKERLVLARGQRVDLSVSADYENFSNRDGTGNVVADMAIALTLQSDQVNNIRWLSSGDVLLCGTAGGEFAVRPLTIYYPFGPDNCTAPSISSYGSKAVAPVKIGDATIFMHRSGTKLRDIVYDGKAVSNDNNVMADHITESGINQLSYQQEPYSIIWATKGNGRLVAMTYSREQFQEAPFGGWHNHPIGGTFNGGPTVVEAISSIPSPDTKKDDLWLIAKRTINGVTRRYVEFIEEERQYNDDPRDSFYVDCGRTLNGVIYDTVYAASGSSVTAASATLTNTQGNIGYGQQTVMDAGTTAFSLSYFPSVLNREIHYHYATLSDEDGRTLIWHTAKGIILVKQSDSRVTVALTTDWPVTATITADLWGLTSTTVSGLDYLEGQSVAILGDGAALTDQVVTGGSIILSSAVVKAQIGIRTLSRLQTMRFNAGAADGTSQTKTSRINKLGIRLFESDGIRFGSSFTTLDNMEIRSTNNPMDNAVTLFTGDEILDFPSDYSTSPWVCIEQSDPLPGTIICLVPIISTQDRS